MQGSILQFAQIAVDRRLRGAELRCHLADSALHIEDACLLQVVKKFEAKGYKPVLRLDANGEPVRTDENNYVVDLHLERIDHPQELAQDLITTVGVVEHGLFLNMVDQVIVGDPNGPRVMDNPNK